MAGPQNDRTLSCCVPEQVGQCAKSHHVARAMRTLRMPAPMRAYSTVRKTSAMTSSTSAAPATMLQHVQHCSADRMGE